MDPDATLREIREAIQRGDAARNNEDAADEYGHAAELFTALDKWMGRGGFAPSDWQRGTRR